MHKVTTPSEAISVNSSRYRSWNTRIAAITISTACVALLVTAFFAIHSSDNSRFTLTTTAQAQYPTGVVDSAEASGVAPPGAQALPGYTLSYVTTFPGTSIPPGWSLFKAVPPNDPGGQFAYSHVVVKNGILSLKAYRDPAFHNEWVTGGLCQCGVAKTSGAYFVRSRITGAGPNEAQLLWPLSNKWPPEVDFNENDGRASGTSSTLHWSPINQIDQRFININMTKWHTWGVIWSPTEVIYTVDGQVWGKISNASEITRGVPMTLNFEQIQHCKQNYECPTSPTSMEVNWVAEYSAKAK
jgi:hypothetical protein